MLAEAFHPGEFVRDELVARGWTQGDLADVIGRPLRMVNELCNGKKRVTARTAVELGAAFGTSAILWMNLDSTYRLHRARVRMGRA